MFKSSCANVHDEFAAAGGGEGGKGGKKEKKKSKGEEIFLQGKRFQGIKVQRLRRRSFM